MADNFVASRVMREQIARASGIPRELYVSEELFDREVEGIFNRSWLLACHESQLDGPGAYVTVESGDESLIVTRTDDGGIAAFHNVCRHRGAQLVDAGCGRVRRRFVCPYHQWTYRLDGSLQGAPKMPPGFDKNAHGLPGVRVTTWHGLVFVNLDSESSEDLTALFSPNEELIAPFDLATARIAHTISYDVAANWKLVWENAQECYHCTANHPEFLRSVDLSAVNAPVEPSCDVPPAEDQLVRSSLFPLKKGATSLTLDGHPASAKLLGEFANGRQPYTASLHLKPTFAVVCCPDYAVILRDRPIAVDRTEVVMTWLVHQDAREGEDYETANLVKVWDETNRQDWALCERTQLGVRSHSFVPGPLSADETSVAGFHQAYLKLLEEAGL